MDPVSRYRVSVDGDDGRARVLSARDWSAAWRQYAVLCAARPAARVALSARGADRVWRVEVERPGVAQLEPRPGRAPAIR